MADILTPALGESVAEASIAKWTKKVGDAVKKDEVLVEPVSYTHLTLPTILLV